MCKTLIIGFALASGKHQDGVAPVSSRVGERLRFPLNLRQRGKERMHGDLCASAIGVSPLDGVYPATQKYMLNQTSLFFRLH
jgi:hypothetical protein